MLTELDYHRLVLTAFESLKREIKDCEDYTIDKYNEIIKAQQKATEDARNVSQPAAGHATKTEKSKETK